MLDCDVVSVSFHVVVEWLANSGDGDGVKLMFQFVSKSSIIHTIFVSLSTQYQRERHCDLKALAFQLEFTYSTFSVLLLFYSRFF